jgi:hypothetical protein
MGILCQENSDYYFLFCSESIDIVGATRRSPADGNRKYDTGGRQLARTASFSYVNECATKRLRDCSETGLRQQILGVIAPSIHNSVHIQLQLQGLETLRVKGILKNGERCSCVNMADFSLR